MKLKYFILSLFLLFCAARLYYQITDDFHAGNILPSSALQKTWEIPAASLKLDPIFDQPYHYLAKGAQSYALLSEDGHYVIKVFKYKHLKIPFYCRLLPFLQKTRQATVARKLNTTLNGYQIAFTMHREESGLIYLHYHNDHSLNRSLNLADKLGRKFSIDLDSTVFVVQKNSVKLRTLLNEMLSQGNLDLAKQRILQVLKMYLSEYRKGIYDHDHGVMHNFGFVQEQPIHFDVGKMYKDASISDPANYQKDLQLVTGRINKWLISSYPQYQQEIVSEIEGQVSQWLDTPFQVPQSHCSA